MWNPEKSLGENRVRVDFNTTNSELAGQIKQKSAELINLINAIQAQEGDKYAGELHRLKALAVTEIEHGAGDAVKAATFYL